MFYDCIPRNWRQGLERKIQRLLNIQTSKECLPVHSSGGVHWDWDPVRLNSKPKLKKSYIP